MELKQLNKKLLNNKRFHVLGKNQPGFCKTRGKFKKNFCSNIVILNIQMILLKTNSSYFHCTNLNFLGKPNPGSAEPGEGLKSFHLKKLKTLTLLPEGAIVDWCF